MMKYGWDRQQACLEERRKGEKSPGHCERRFDILHEALEICLGIQAAGDWPQAQGFFIPALETNADLKALRTSVNSFATTFPMPGFDPKEMKYQDPAGPPETI
jgi:hypothetical protein